MFERLGPICALAVAATPFTPGLAGAVRPATGGASAPGPVAVERAVCASGETWVCGRGQRLSIVGAGMNGVDRVIFLGRSGARDNRVASPVRRTDGQLTLFVPKAARTGRLRLHSMTEGMAEAPKRLRVVAAPAKASVPGADGSSTPIAEGRFPIDGRHDMGQSETNGFGGGRGHQGHDLFAACGTPLVAVRDATVQHVATHGAAGNYVVLRDASGRSYAYMHLRARALVDKGEHVAAGQRLGFVGDTGRATGCHLHFELWTAPGWYTGGRPVDPLPQLKLWHRKDDEHRH